MKNFYEKEIHLRSSDFDINKRLLPSAVLDLFQIVAGEHANILGCGSDNLLEKELLWVLVRTKYEVYKQPEMYQKVAVKTWPLAPSRAGFQREYIVRSDNGETFIKGTSEWVVINKNTRRMVRTEGIYPEDLNHLEDKNFPDRLSKIADFEQVGEGYFVSPGYSQLDINGHVNNTKYANYAIDALNIQDLNITSLQIDYRKEVYLNEKVEIFVKRENKNILVKGIDSEEKVKFACEIAVI